MNNNNAILLISCKDALGITAGVTNFIFQYKGNILHADQHIDDQTNTFFMRVEWSLEHFELIKREAFTQEFEKIARPFQMNWELSYSNEKQKCAIFVSKKTHCLVDILSRYKENQLNCDINLVLSNHTKAKEITETHNINFQHFPITRENKADQEKAQFKLLEEKDIDFLILAQYHQILTPYLINKFPNKIINIHHSFLPAFPGTNPYEQAYAKGVKIIGATSHFVNEKLDDGPIIAQDTVKISHRDKIEDLQRKGEDLEKLVLNQAVRLFLCKKILTYNSKTCIFD